MAVVHILAGVICQSNFFQGDYTSVNSSLAPLDQEFQNIDISTELRGTSVNDILTFNSGQYVQSTHSNFGRQVYCADVNYDNKYLRRVDDFGFLNGAAGKIRALLDADGNSRPLYIHHIVMAGISVEDETIIDLNSETGEILNYSLLKLAQLCEQIIADGDTPYITLLQNHGESNELDAESAIEEYAKIDLEIAKHVGIWPTIVFPPNWNYPNIKAQLDIYVNNNPTKYWVTGSSSDDVITFVENADDLNSPQIDRNTVSTYTKPGDPIHFNGRVIAKLIQEGVDRWEEIKNLGVYGTDLTI